MRLNFEDQPLWRGQFVNVCLVTLELVLSIFFFVFVIKVLGGSGNRFFFWVSLEKKDC